MALVTGLGYVLLGSARIPEWRALAESAGLAAEDDGLRGGTRVRLDEWALRLLIRPADEEVVQAIGWQVADRRTFEETLERLQKEGFEVEECERRQADLRGVTRAARLSDPAGLPVEIAVAPHVDPVNRLVTPHGVQFVTGPCGLGHVVLHVDCFDDEIDFYTRVLGFEIRDSMSAMIRGAFLGCNPRHHSIAILETGATRFDHLMLEVTDLDDVGRAFDRVTAAGLVDSTIGRWGPDRMVSFYGKTPSGFALEIGYGGLLVDETWAERQLGVPAGSVWGHKPVA